MSITSSSARYFAQVAGDWDSLRTGYFTEAVRDAALAKAYSRPEMVVADVGSGTGFVAAGLAPLVSRVYALDGSPEMLAVAQRNLAAFDNITYRVADGAELPLEDGSVDAVFANMYLHHCPDPQAAIREMVRVLRPGGRLVITDLDRHEHAWMRAEFADEWLGFERAQVHAWLREAGLVNLVVDRTGECCTATASTGECCTPATANTAGCCTPAAANTGSCCTPAAVKDEAAVSVFLATGSRRVGGARQAVQASYGAVAEAGGHSSGANCCSPEPAAASCCAPAGASSSCCAPSAVSLAPENTQNLVMYHTGYAPEDLAGLPDTSVQLSLGCGNPGGMASLRPGETVLDIGSGAGIDALYAARRVGPTGHVIGLDMTPAMLARAREAAAEAGADNVEFRQGEAEAMPVDDATVDIVLSNCVINLCEDKGKVFEEAYRVLRPGGRVSISDMVTDGPLPAEVRGDPAMWAGCVNGALPQAEYLDLVRQAGFVEVVAVRTLSGGQLRDVGVYSLAVTAKKA